MAVLAMLIVGTTMSAPAAIAEMAVKYPAIPAPSMHGYASGPAQLNGTAAGKSHYVPASATRTSLTAPGHAAPAPDLAPPAMAARKTAQTGAVKTAPGHAVTHASGRQAQGAKGASAASASSAATVADDASYSVAATYDTVPMANQTGRVAVTLTNTGTATWSGGFGLSANVYASSDTTGTGAPLTTGQDVTFQSTVAPGQSVTVESVTPNEAPGSYEICWDMETASGAYFSADGGSTYCEAYTIQQYPAQITEQSPLPGTSENTQTPQLSASASVPGGYPVTPEFWFAFEVVTQAPNGTWGAVQSSGWVANNGNIWTVPKPLPWGATYYWQVAVSDAAAPPNLSSTSVTWTTPISFVVGDAQPAVWNRFGPEPQTGDGNPVMTSDLGAATYTGSGKTVDPKTANVTQQATDASVAGAGPTLSVLRTYNSLDPRTSQAFGAGWSSVQDMSLDPDPDGSGALILTLADGQQARFAVNAAGGYAPPANLYAVVTPLSGGGFSVTDQTDTTYSFAEASGSDWLLSKITDDEGGTETFGYAGGALATVTNNVSGRALHLTWSTPSGAAHPHVATVSTDPVTAGQSGTALTWTYGYNSDLLTSVCPPGTATACTTYTYTTNGSHAPTAVLNASPTAYYRLDDASGTTAAANEVPVNDLTTVNPPATEMSTTLGASGPVKGVSATSFNGTSSYIPMDGAWCTTASATSSCIPVTGSNRIVTPSTTNLGFSLWFKTSTASGVLLGMTAALPGGCTACSATDATPVLWITSTGQLAGAGSLTSTASVDDGNWHQAVLIPGQALYVDGVKVASGSTAFSTIAGTYALLGTGLVPSGSTAGWQYFNGSLADFAIYQNQLPGVGTVAAQYSAETTSAAELTGITSPGGRTEMSATYDTVNDRVATLTDAHGGNWAYGSPVPQSLSAGYDDAVLASAPEDFWPLSDSTGPLAHDLVGGAATAAVARPPATYTDITLGAAGPTGFADGTAAAFTGSGSQISIPGGYFTGGGGAGESTELWFSATAAGTLLSTGSGTGGNPPTLWVNSSGCVEGTLDGALLQATTTCASAIGDGKWHQVVLTLTPVGTNSTGTASIQTATLYEDGKVLASATISPATVSTAGYTAVVGNGTHGDFTGSVADVSLYTAALSATDVTAHYAGLRNQVLVKEPSSNPALPAYLATPTLDSQSVAVTDPFGKNAAYVYASGQLIKTTDVLGGVTWYGYDASNRATTATDPDGYTTYTTHDARNNVTSTTTCAAINDCQTSYESYYENPSNPVDPRNNKPTDQRDARSSSPSDPAYDTVTSYTPSAELASKTTPPTTACPSGCATTYTYTTGSESAVGGGTEPPGLLASTAAPNGGTTKYKYDSAGDVASVTSALGLVTSHTYDNLGRELTSTQTSDTYPAGLTTTSVYDSLDRVVKQTDPPVTDRVTGAVHTEVTVTTYDPDDDVLTTTVSDKTGGDASRTTTNTYDAFGQLASVTDPLGHVTKYTYDALGDRTTQTNPAGLTTAYTYDPAGNLLTTTIDGYTGNPSAPIPAENVVQDSRSYDPAGNLASDTNAKGTTTDYTYYGNGALASGYVVGPMGSESVQTSAYDAAGNKISATSPGGLVVDTVYNANNQVISQTTDPTGVDRTSSAVYDADGNVLTQKQTGGGVAQTETMTYNATDEQLSQTVDDTGGDLTTKYVRDERGLVISETDPAGNTTTYENDEAGRTVVTTSPAVPVQSGTGGAPVTADPVIMTGYDTYGDKAETSDADGNVTTYAFDQDSQAVSVTDPSYTPPGSSTPVDGTTTTVYNDLGQQTSQTDPMGNTAKYGYDQLGNEASETDPGSGVTTYTYDPAGEQLSETDPTGAQSQTTYDALGRKITTTDLVRQNASAAYTTTYGYDDAGNQTSQTSPTGVVTRAAYDAVGERISSTDAAGNTTHYAYDLDGNLVKTTLPDGTASTATYDLAGRETAQAQLDASGAVQRSESATYTPDGQAATSTDYRGDTSTFTYDATGMLTSQTQPASASASITVAYGYDPDGNRTALTDGNGHTTYTTYNSRGLAQTSTEPSTATYDTAADSTTTTVYNADGDAVTADLPGGVQVSDTYNAMGDLTAQSGSGASAATATRSFGYDAAGRLLTAATGAVGTSGSSGYQPATSETFQYDDRGLILSASGSAGDAVYTYNPDAQLATAADAAGTSTYTYDSAGRLQTDADAASGATGTYSYNSLDQVTGISYGAGENTQSLGYDTLHRLSSDTVATASGATVASIGYGYNANDDVTSMTTSGLANSGGTTGTVTNTYGYDEADRLTSWTAAPSGAAATTDTYAYDNDGNLTNDNGVTYTYDARDELVSSSTGTSYTYTANGELQSSGSEPYTFDAYGQQISAGLYGYTWDALNRVVTAGEKSGSSVGEAVTYEGMTREVASDSSATYSRDPAGDLAGVHSAAGGAAIALNDQHDDLSGLFTAGGTALTESTTYGPWGQPAASTGTAVQIGYQGQWTDPQSGQVNMGSRFYQPGTGSFTSVDTYTGAQGGKAAVSDDLYAYGDDNPVTVTDPTGHAPSTGSGGGDITAGQVAAAAARAAQARAASLSAYAAAAGAKVAASAASAAAAGAEALARTLNSAAQKAAALASRLEQMAAAEFRAAAAELKVAESWQAQADAAWKQVQNDLSEAVTWEVWKIPGYLSAAAKETAVALSDEWHAAGALLDWGTMELAAAGLQLSADIATGASKAAALLARGAAAAAALATRLADAAARTARELSAYAAEESAIASRDASEATALARAYAVQEARKIAAAARAAKAALEKAKAQIERGAAKALQVAGSVGMTVLKVAYQASGLQSIVSCVTDPSVAGCVQAGISILTDLAVVGTAGAGAGVAVAEDALEEGAIDAGEAAAEDGASAAAKASSAKKNVVIQLGIGGVSGAVGNAGSGYAQGQSTGQILADAGVGLVTGAISNIPLGKGVSAYGWGAASGGLNGYLTQGISTGDWSNPDVTGIANDARLGGITNMIGWSVGLNNGDTWGNLISGSAGLVLSAQCTKDDKVQTTDC
jgi:RHS repeat-associated protein